MKRILFAVFFIQFLLGNSFLFGMLPDRSAGPSTISFQVIAQNSDGLPDTDTDIDPDDPDAGEDAAEDDPEYNPDLPEEVDKNPGLGD